MSARRRVGSAVAVACAAIAVCGLLVADNAAKHPQRNVIGGPYGRLLADSADLGAARAGQTNITYTASIEWAHSGVRVNSVIPGLASMVSASASQGDRSHPC